VDTFYTLNFLPAGTSVAACCEQEACARARGTKQHYSREQRCLLRTTGRSSWLGSILPPCVYPADHHHLLFISPFVLPAPHRRAAVAAASRIAPRRALRTPSSQPRFPLLPLHSTCAHRHACCAWRRRTAAARTAPLNTPAACSRMLRDTAAPPSCDIPSRLRLRCYSLFTAKPA